MFAMIDPMDFARMLIDTYQDLHSAVHDWVSLGICLTAVVVLPVFVMVQIVTMLGRRWLAAWARHALWTLVLIRLVLPISFRSPFSVQNLWFLTRVKESREQDDQGQSLPRMWLDEFFAAMSEPTLSTSSLCMKVLEVLVPIVLMGSVFVALRTLIKFCRLVNWTRHGTRVTDPGWLCLIDEGRRQFGVQVRITLRTVHQLTCPTTIDWFRPILLLPEDALALSATERRHVIWHELARIRRGNSAISPLLALVQIVHWWNPLFWWTKRCWLIERELACDELALDRLSESQRAGYDATLQMFLKRQSRHCRSWIALDTVGFLMFLGGNASTRRRLEGCSRFRRSEGRWQRGVAWSILFVIAMTGLSDTTASRPEPNADTVIDLPAGIIWRDSAGTESKILEPDESRTYDLRECISRLCQDDPLLTEEAAGERFRVLLDRMLQPNVSQKSFFDPPVTAAKPIESKCQLLNQQLIVLATATQHQRIAKQLSSWAVHGQQNICFEIRWTKTRKQIDTLLPNAGGEVINSVSLPFQSEASLVNSPLILPHTTSRQLQQFPSPVFVRVLTAAETQLLTARIAEDERSNIMAATKSNMLEGSLGTASSGVSRPFVTGFLGSSFSRFTPQITAAQGGFSVEFIGFVESEQVHLHAICILSEILDTHVRKLKSQSHEMQIQIPQVRETFVDSTAVLDVDQTLLLIPLRRDPQGNLSLLLITTQILDVQ